MLECDALRALVTSEVREGNTDVSGIPILLPTYGRGRTAPRVEGTMEDSTLGASRAAPATRHGDHPLPETLAEAEKLAASIERAVWRETGGRVRNLRVEVDRQGVTLLGRCPTYHIKQQAQHAAMAFRNGGLLCNEIEVC